MVPIFIGALSIAGLLSKIIWLYIPVMASSLVSVSISKQCSLKVNASMVNKKHFELLFSLFSQLSLIILFYCRNLLNIYCVMLCNIMVMDKVRKKVFYFSENKQTSLIKDFIRMLLSVRKIIHTL